jgi:cell division protein FtsB
MKTGLKLATLGLVASLVALIWQWRIQRTLASENLRLSRQNAALRAELRLAAREATQVVREAVTLDTQLGAARIALTERTRRETDLLAELASLRQQSAQTADAAAAAGSGAAASPVTVVRLGPEDAFVILSGGTAHGLGPGVILGLHRGTTELARVQITDARPRHSVARVIPGTLKGKLQTGDLALLTP